MDERAIEEFASVFEAAVEPAVAIEPVTWCRVLVGLDGSTLSEAALAAGLSLAAREKLPLEVVAPHDGGNNAALQAQLEAALTQAAARGVEAAGRCVEGAAADVLLAALCEPCSLLALPTPFGSAPSGDSLGTVLDAILTATDTPLLLCKQPLPDPAQLFQRLLVYVPGGFEVGPHFSIPFALVAPDGRLDLVHIVNEQEIERVATALKLAPQAESTSSETIAHSLETRMQKLLAQAVARVSDQPYEARCRVATGQPLAWLALHLLNERHTLLVVDSETRKGEPIPAESYAVLKQVSGVPLLVL